MEIHLRPEANGVEDALRRDRQVRLTLDRLEYSLETARIPARAISHFQLLAIPGSVTTLC